MNSNVRVRFAPSPTGYLHVGGGRSALYNYLFAKKHNGKLILRIEDTDQARSTEESLKMMVADLKWLELKWDEGPDPETLKDMGPHAPYRQSQRLEIYQREAQRLLQSGKAYYCFLTDAEIEAQRERAQKEGRPPHVESPYSTWPLEKSLKEISSGKKAVVRFHTSPVKKDYVFQDLVRGEVKFPSDMVGDFVLLRSDGMPVYNFCCVVDDAEMKISHVLRAEEHLPNTLRQLMLYEALGYPLPEFGHMSLILDEDRQKMSKRRGATSCNEFKEQGFLPEALENFLALLGWSHPEGKEIFSREDLISHFSIERVHAAPAVFDEKKLRWMNATYIRNMSPENLWKLIERFLQRDQVPYGKDPAWQVQSAKVFQTALEVLTDAIPLYRLLVDEEFKVLPEASEVLSWESTPALLAAWVEVLKGQKQSYISEADFLRLQDQVKEKTGAKGKFLFMALRVAVIGKPQGTEIKHLAPLIPVSSLILRAQKVMEHSS